MTIQYIVKLVMIKEHYTMVKLADSTILHNCESCYALFFFLFSSNLFCYANTEPLFNPPFILVENGFWKVCKVFLEDSCELLIHVFVRL